jgi:magnesium-protoporphyrin O-methyltransferase
MSTLTYQLRRGEIETYFDRTAAEAWKRLTSDAPVGSIRATVRAGRDEMRRTLFDWLPLDLGGRRILDAGCGTGAFAIEAARRGADVVGVDLSPTLIEHARERLPRHPGPGRVTLSAGDMLAEELGQFDHIVGMDSLIHYGVDDAVAAVARLARRASRSILFTFAPRTPMLTVMHAAGRLFPRGDRAPSIVPVSEATLAKRISREAGLADWTQGRTRRVMTGFYKSQALELVRQ